MTYLCRAFGFGYCAFVMAICRSSGTAAEFHPSTSVWSFAMTA